MSWRQLAEDDPESGRDDLESEAFAYDYVTWDWYQEQERRHPPPPSPPGSWIMSVAASMPAGIESQRWTEALFVYWERNAMAFFSLVDRLKGFKARKSVPITAAEADRRFRWHLAKCRPVPLVAPTEALLSQDTYHGLDLNPTPVARGEWDELGDHLGPWPRLGWKRARQFWVKAFASLVIDDLAPRCQRCEVLLPNTPSGRRSRRAHCERCTFQLWDAKLTPDERRARWREAKQHRRRK
ncbi:MAG TPA: hypothetical protein VD866_17545 [Urbifossiella sp.]|nr:hypothetical protein [Urbifossiella sp.]